MKTLATAHVAANRIVFTYEPDGWPAGLVTGYSDYHGDVPVFQVEHVCVFPKTSTTTLLRMARLGIEEAWGRGFERIVYGVPRAFPLMPALARLGERLGFEEYGADQDYRYFIKHRVDG
jgi:hypothetical protein